MGCELPLPFRFHLRALSAGPTRANNLCASPGGFDGILGESYAGNMDLIGGHKRRLTIAGSNLRGHNISLAASSRLHSLEPVAETTSTTLRIPSCFELIICVLTLALLFKSKVGFPTVMNPSCTVPMSPFCLGVPRSCASSAAEQRIIRGFSTSRMSLMAG